MSLLFINRTEDQIELEDGAKLLTAPFNTDIFDEFEFTYTDLISAFMSLPSNPREKAKIGDDWWVIHANDEEIDAGNPQDNVMFEKTQRPDFLGKTTYIELIRKGNGWEEENLVDADGEHLEDLGASYDDDIFNLMHALKYLTRYAKEKTGYIAVTPWYVTYAKGKSAKKWKLWIIAEAQKGEIPTWQPSWSEE